MVLWSVGQWVFSDFCVEVNRSISNLTELSSSGCWSERIALPSHLALTRTDSVILQVKAASSSEMSVHAHYVCLNKVLTTPAIFPFSIGTSEVVVAMDGIHADFHYSKYVSEYNCRLARHGQGVSMFRCRERCSIRPSISLCALFVEWNEEPQNWKCQTLQYLKQTLRKELLKLLAFSLITRYVLANTERPFKIEQSKKNSLAGEHG